MLLSIVAALLALATLVGLFCLNLYGYYLCFAKKWYIGAVALFIPGFALIIGIAKLVFKKDLLK